MPAIGHDPDDEPRRRRGLAYVLLVLAVVGALVLLGLAGRSFFNRPADSVPTPEPVRLAEENRQLKRAVEELSILNDLARSIGASVDSEDIIRKIVDRSMRAVRAEQTVVTLVDRQEDQTMKTLVRAISSSAEHPKLHLNQSRPSLRGANGWRAAGPGLGTGGSVAQRGTRARHERRR